MENTRSSSKIGHNIVYLFAKKKCCFFLPRKMSLIGFRRKLKLKGVINNFTATF